MKLKANARLKAYDVMSDPDQAFKTAVSTINQLLTDAARSAEHLVSTTQGPNKKKAQQLEDKIDAVRHFAFKLR